MRLVQSDGRADVSPRLKTSANLNGELGARGGSRWPPQASIIKAMVMANNPFWTYDDLEKLFNRSFMTIYLWRRDLGLPALQISERRVIFYPHEVVAWAQANNKEYDLEAAGLVLVPKRRKLNYVVARSVEG